MDGAVRAVGGKERGAHVSADLCSAENTCFAAALLALQRRRRAVPLAMPLAHHLASALHSVATSERSEAADSVVWSILKEDVMLGLGAEMRHGSVESQP